MKTIERHPPRWTRLKTELERGSNGAELSNDHPHEQRAVVEAGWLTKRRKKKDPRMGRRKLGDGERKGPNP